MDQNEKKKVENPRQNANIFSIITFWWIRKLFLLGYKRELQESDLYSPLREDASENVGQYITKVWNDELERCEEKKDGSKPSLFKTLFKCFAKSLIGVGVGLSLLEFGLRIAQPFLLAELLHYFSLGREEWGADMYYYAVTFCLLPVIDSFLKHWCLQTLCHVGMKIRVACCALIYTKILKLSNSVLENETSTGQMVNFLSNDVNRLNYSVFTIHYVWIAPLQTIVITYLIYREIGWPAIIGTLILLTVIPIQLCVGRSVSKLALVSAHKVDKRLRLMNQIIAGLEIIKMYVWEVPYSLLVGQARRKEVNVIKKYSIIEHFALTLDLYIPRLCLFVTILTYVLTGNNITVEKVFLITAFYNVLRETVTIGFSLSVQEIAEATVSIKRLRKFMMHSEISKPETKLNCVATREIPVYMENVSARWDEFRENTLQDINLTVRSGNLVAIVGQIGSGKSSLLQAILRELPLENGTLEIYGKLSYASQRPWIFASSVRQNILFGQPMDETRYNEIIRVCQLKADVDSFPHGDRTIVGERGINLSGGQRARINLARALYADAVTYLLDDPLSAVDTHVGSRIVEECICGYLNDKTRILVTHQLQYLKYADLIIVMNNGSIQAKGTFQEIQGMQLDFMQIVNDVDESKDDEELQMENEENLLIEEKEKKDKTLLTDPIEVAETRTMGKVSGTVYLAYLKASKSAFLITLAFVFFVANQATASLSDYLIAFWVNIEASSWVTNDNGTTVFEWNGPISRDMILYLYSGLTASVVCICMFQLFTYYELCMKSSKNLHADMFRSIIRTTMYFYNTNPAGRILNRFSKDIGIIDRKLPLTLFDVLLIGFIFVGVLAIIGVVNPWLLLPAVAIIIVIYFLRKIYIPTGRAIKRMEGTTQSPVFDHVGATLQGLATVRAFEAEEILTTEFHNHQDLHTSSWFLFLCTSRSFGMWVEMACSIYIALIIAVFLVFDNFAAAGDIGLVITQLISVTGALQWGMRQTAELENQITSVERVLEYSKLEEEPFLDSKTEKKPREDWPNKGCVEFKDVKLKYGPNGTYVLKTLNFTIMPKEKIGVVGRTGAGKTSLISALFRLAYVEGEILIDGINTATIALHDFRSKISIIPQEPVLFGGSLRRNLDPFDQYSDNALWNALEEVELKETISDMAAGLNTKVAEDGLNFSVGQRQLLCLVRALVRNNKIMVLDEATANVDPVTDSLIQKTVRRKFKDCTVITIAHRLNTIMDSDKILVMDQGCVVEFDSPYVLLQKKGFFFNMVQRTGPGMANTLFEVARDNFYGSNKTPS